MAFGIADSKSILTSKTFYGALLALTSVLFPSFYLHLMTAIGIDDPSQIADKIVAVIGALLTIYGRFAANQPVTLTGSPAIIKTDDPIEQTIITTPDSTTVRKMAIVETTTTIIPVDEQAKQNKVEIISP